MALRDRLSVDDLRKLLLLDPATGRLYWLPRGPEWFKDGQQTAEHVARRWNRKYAGKEALTATEKSGSRIGAIFNQMAKAHQVVFALHHGRWPVGDVDHIDRDPSNNRPSNLREATRSQNLRNRASKPGSASRYLGVSWHGASRMWIARYSLNNRLVKVGYFPTEELAARAYDAAVSQVAREFAALNFPCDRPNHGRHPECAPEDHPRP